MGLNTQFWKRGSESIYPFTSIAHMLVPENSTPWWHFSFHCNNTWAPFPFIQKETGVRRTQWICPQQVHNEQFQPLSVWLWSTSASVVPARQFWEMSKGAGGLALQPVRGSKHFLVRWGYHIDSRVKHQSEYWSWLVSHSVSRREDGKPINSYLICRSRKAVSQLDKCLTWIIKTVVASPSIPKLEAV